MDLKRLVILYVITYYLLVTIHIAKWYFKILLIRH